jgi:predicted RNA-binding Zn-ribbon protein involved in translation (DUF1610 family)
MLTREAFEQHRHAARRVARHDGRALAFSSVGLGLAQLVFLRWADVHLARGPRLIIAGLAFLAYLALVAVLIWRMEKRLRAVRPVCPQCGVTLKDMAERVAAVTGRCEACGGWVLEEADRPAP